MRRTQLARTFLVEKDIYFLDEPTLGQDPVGRVKVWNLIKELAKRRVTIFLATNDMYEAETLCSRICFINKGKIITISSPERLKALSGTIKVEIDCINTFNRLDLSNVQGLLNYEFDKKTIKVELSNSGEAIVDLLSKIKEYGIKVEDIRIKRTRLEDVFMRLIR